MLSTPNRLPLLVFILTLFPKKAQLQVFTGGFDQNFYYGPEGGNAEICLFVANFTTIVTGTIIAIDGTATGTDYSSTSLPFDVTINSSEPVCYNISLFDDSISEGFETFTVYFVTNNTSDEISRDNATVTITDDDDIDECADYDHNCNSSGLCWNTDGSFLCVYSGFGCEDIYECATDSHSCDRNATCTNTLGSFNCTCNPGYTGNGTVCEDTDECAARSHNNCSSNAICKNTAGSYQCTCYPSYVGNGTFCEDFDECFSGIHNCPDHSTCKNTVGSFQCPCDSGFDFRMGRCDDIDECLAETHNCSGNSTCNNTVGSFNCPCDTGFFKIGTICQDVDECLVPSQNNCSSNATCNNTVGSFQCACNPGYVRNGTFCEDFDECFAGTHNCPDHSTCKNTVSSFECPCDSGFDVRMGACADIDECLVPSQNNCNKNATCNNTVGSFQCICNPGYVRNGTICEGLVRHRASLRFKQNYTTELSDKNSQEFKDIETRITTAVDKIYADNTEYFGVEVKELRNGSIIADIELTFTDKDKENLTGLIFAIRNNSFGDFNVDPNALLIPGRCKTHNCPKNSGCEQVTDDTVSCPCNEGYYYDGLKCVVLDIDSCPDNIDSCHDKAECINNAGSFYCSCKSGYSGNGTYCEAEPGSPSPSSSVINLGAIIGIVVAIAFVVIVAIAIFVTCFFWKERNTGNNENNAYDNVLSPGIELPQLYRSVSGYEQPSPYAQLDSSRRVPMDENYQSLNVENHAQRDPTLDIITSERSDIPEHEYATVT